MATGRTHNESSSHKIVVAAMDFGTTYSGCTFAFTEDYNKNPIAAIKTPKTWNGPAKALQSLKTPTVILLDKDKKFKAFGYEAEEQYHSLVFEEKHTDYYYFRRFKMKLHTTSVMNLNMTINDESGKPCEALTVFKLAIGFLKEHLESILTDRGIEFGPDDIHWVLTVPAIWSDSAKQFMRIAATKAGIKDEDLTIALEPEAASILCMKLPWTNADNPSQNVQGFPRGTRYMVADMGGGTVDITVHEVADDQSLKEVAPPTGGPWGGTTVDESFVELFKRIFGEDVYKSFEEDYQDDVIDLYRGIEIKKRNIKAEQDNSKILLTIPVSLVDRIKERHRISDIAQIIDSNKTYKGRVDWKRNRLTVDTDIFRHFYDTMINKTIEEIKTVLSECSCNVDIILLVGGCAESPLVKQRIRESFQTKRILIPEDAELSVLKGAVIYGHCPTIIISRIAKFSYGIRVYKDFDHGHHPSDKLVILDRKRKCKDVFAPHITKGQELVVGVAQASRRYTSLEQEQTSLVFDFFTSNEKSPEFVTDPSCTFIGQLEVMLDGKGKGRTKAALVSVIYGGTEIVARGVHEETGEKTEVKMTLLKID